jgi:hypothetical protein
MSKDDNERKPFRVLQRDELLALAKKPSQGTATAIVVSPDETSWTPVLLDDDAPLPGNHDDWSIQGVVVFISAMSHRFPPDKVAQSTGNDLLYVELLGDPLAPGSLLLAARGVARGITINAALREIAPPIDQIDKVRIVPNFVLKGQVCVVLVEGNDTPQLAHVSNIDTVACSFVTLSHAGANTEAHPMTSDGQRVAGINCDGIPPLLLRMLAQREQPCLPEPKREILRMPMQNASFLPNTPTVGERKRRKRGDKSFEYIVKWGERRANRERVAVDVQLDAESMRLATLSHTKKRTEKRNASIQLQLPYPKKANTEAEIQEAIQGVLQHFHTDFLPSFDALTALLVARSNNSAGIALDETLEREVVAMRFGSTHAANHEQRKRVHEHFQTLMKLRVMLTPQQGSKAFRGAIIIRVGEVVDTGDGSVEPLKVGDMIMLNPMLYSDIVHKGKGMFVDARYFQLNPYQQDWNLRIYRYLAARWSANSTKLVGQDWTLHLQVHTLLDMSGIDWQTQAIGQDRGTAHTRRRLDAALESLRTEDMIGAWHIDGDGLADDAKLTVVVPEAIRKQIVACRPGLHADAASGALQARRKVKPKAIRKAR